MNDTETPYPPTPPLPVVPGASNYARRVWWRGFELTPGVQLHTEAVLRPSLAARAEEPRELLLALARAASAALTLHPQLNYFTFWGRLAWAGWPARVGVVMENRDQSCDMVVLSGAHLAGRGELLAALKVRPQGGAPGLRGRLREALPLATYAAERLTGSFARHYMRINAPLFISMLALPGVEGASFTPAHSMALFPGWPTDGRLPLTLCHNHQLANARPTARLLLTIKDLLE
jgi:hypothetical protein